MRYLAISSIRNSSVEIGMKRVSSSLNFLLFIVTYILDPLVRSFIRHTVYDIVMNVVSFRSLGNTISANMEHFVGINDLVTV